MIKEIAMIALLLASQPTYVASDTTYVGEYTATEYCRHCNTPAGSTKTASGRYVPGYSVASSELPLGTILEVDGKEYRVDDTGCPRGRIDFLVGDNGSCNCSRKEIVKVWERK